MSIYLVLIFVLGVGIGGLLLVVYTAHGGIKSVAFTDLFQGLILFIVVPIIMVAVLKQVGGVKHVLTQIPPSTAPIISTTLSHRIT